MDDSYTRVKEKFRINTGIWLQKQVETGIFYNFTALHCIRHELGLHWEVSGAVLLNLRFSNVEVEVDG